MCIVVDANTFSSVFNSSCSEHFEFEPVRQWVVEGDGFLVYGGTKYKKELASSDRYRRLILRLKDARRVREVDTKLVDKEEMRVVKCTEGTCCDDQHIIAIFIVSRCRLFCSKDCRADQFIQDKSLYPKKHPRPSIYRKREHSHLLSKGNIVHISNET